MKNARKQNISLLLFCTPALVVYILFKLYPALSGVFYSLTNWNGLKKEYDFVGLSNFIEILSDKYFWNSMWFTFKYVIVIVIVSNVAALTLAVAIESRRRAKGLYRTVFYMPNMISMVIGGYMWMFIFTKVLYYMADNWGWKFLDHSWIGDPKYSFIAIMIVAAWGATGYLMIIYMAALQGVPANLKEAASIDGADSWQNFWKIVFPLIGHAITICVFWALNAGFQVFDVIYTLTGGARLIARTGLPMLIGSIDFADTLPGGGPGRATQSVAINIYEEAFRGNIRYGYATAKSTVLFIIVLAVTAVQLRITGRKEQEL